MVDKISTRSRRYGEKLVFIDAFTSTASIYTAAPLDLEAFFIYFTGSTKDN